MLLRLLSYLLLLIPLVCSPFEQLFVHADADFESVRVRLNRDHSGKAGDPKEKYFRQYSFSLIRAQPDANMATLQMNRCKWKIRRKWRVVANSKKSSFHPHYDGR